MAFITYVAPDTLAPGDRVADPDNIIQIHAVHPAVKRQHWELYKALMHRPGPLSRRERELLGVRRGAHALSGGGALVTRRRAARGRPHALGLGTRRGACVRWFDLPGNASSRSRPLPNLGKPALTIAGQDRVPPRSLRR